jgi:hypothetical protein
MRHPIFALVGAGALVAVMAGCETRDDTVDTGVTTPPPPATTPATPPPPAPPLAPGDTLMRDTLQDTLPGAPGTGTGPTP